MKLVHYGALLALTLSACATVDPVPNTRKFTPDLMSQIGKTDIVLTQSDGIRAGWTSAGVGPAQDYSYVIPAGTSPAAAGIGAGLGHAIGVAIVDAGPSARAKRAAKSINSSIDKAALDKKLIRKLQLASSAGQVKPGQIDVQEFKRKDPEPNGKLKVKTSYTLAEDASAIRVTADVTYMDESLAYTSPYNFEGKPPKEEMEGPLYRNRFTFHSDKFETPELTETVKQQLTQAINSQYQEDIADLNSSELTDKKREKESSKLLKRKEKALISAQDDKLKKMETAILLINEWKGSANPALDTAIDDAHDFIAKMLFADLNDSNVPQFERKTPLPEKKSSFWKAPVANIGPIGTHEFTEMATLESGRKVVRLDSGYYAGSYHSYPDAGFAGYGNTYKIAR